MDAEHSRTCTDGTSDRRFQHKVAGTYACQQTLTIKGQTVMGGNWVPSFQTLNLTWILQWLFRVR